MAITILLLNRKRVQTQELADRLEVSLRTIYRDLESLNLAGIPIVCTREQKADSKSWKTFDWNGKCFHSMSLLPLYSFARSSIYASI